MFYDEAYERFYGKYFSAREREQIYAKRLQEGKSIDSPTVGLFMTLSGAYHPQRLPLPETTAPSA